MRRLPHRLAPVQADAYTTITVLLNVSSAEHSWRYVSGVKCVLRCIALRAVAHVDVALIMAEAWRSAFLGNRVYTGRYPNSLEPMALLAILGPPVPVTDFGQGVRAALASLPLPAEVVRREALSWRDALVVGVRCDDFARGAHP